LRLRRCLRQHNPQHLHALLFHCSPPPLLTEQLGNVHLEKHLASVITLMRISPTWPDFERFMMKAFPDRTIPNTLELPFKDTTPL
jgi:hypothetical protein